jgi:nucleoside-triphosphatase THEP1
VQVSYCSPEILLASFLSKKDQAFKLLLLSGESGVGKTAWCTQLIYEAGSSGISLVGIISPAVFENGIKTGIDLVMLHTGERRRLAGRRNDHSSAQLPGSPITLDWFFDPWVLEWGNRHLSKLPKGDLLILDELGPLEFTKNAGLTAGLVLIDSCRFRLMCVVVRPALLAMAQSRWPWAETMDLTGQVGGWERGKS